MPFRDVLLPENRVACDDKGFDLTLGLPRYRSLPLSCVRVHRLLVDGKEMDPNAMAIRINGKEFTHDRLPDLYDEWWFVADRADLRVNREGRLSTGDHDFDLSLALRIPYVFVEGESECPIEVIRIAKRMRVDAGQEVRE